MTDSMIYQPKPLVILFTETLQLDPGLVPNNVSLYQISGSTMQFAINKEATSKSALICPGVNIIVEEANVFKYIVLEEDPNPEVYKTHLHLFTILRPEF